MIISLQSTAVCAKSTLRDIFALMFRSVGTYACTNLLFSWTFPQVYYIILAFFGTGNIASLNSFEIRWVTCFVTSFQPFLITTLILLKTFAPFMVVGCGFVAVQTLTEVGFTSLFWKSFFSHCWHFVTQFGGFLNNISSQSRKTFNVKIIPHVVV